LKKLCTIIQCLGLQVIVERSAQAIELMHSRT
jgi:hypothetical protein